MTVQRPSYAQNLGNVYTAEEMRRVNAMEANRRAGINATGDYAVSQNGTPNMTCNVAAGEALVAGSETLTQGLYYVYNDAVVNRTIAASDATNPRRDLVVIRVRDQFYSGTFNDADVIVVTGTPAPSPADPAAPANSLVLARIAVAANATTITNANITDLRIWQAQRLFPGPQGLHVRNSGDTADTLALDNNGFVILGGAISVPPAFGVALAPSNYGSTMVKIGEVVTSASQVSVTFSSIPQGFRHLQSLVVGRGDTAGIGGDIYRTDLQMQFNGDTAANYATQVQDNSGGTVSTALITAGNTMAIGHVATASATAGTPGSSRIDIPGYSGSTFIKQAMSQSMRADTGATGHLRWGSWNNTAAITSILLKLATGNFVANSVVTLYGIP